MNAQYPVSIIIPVYNGAKTLKTCLDSVLTQEDSFIECIVVDNNSTDATKDIVVDFMSAHPKLVYVFERIRGRGVARNTGTIKAKGSVIMMTDADCVAPPNWVEEMSKPIREKRESVVVGGEYDVIENYWSRHTQKMYDYLRGSNDYSNPYTLFIDTKNFAIDTLLLRKVPFDANFQALEDEEIMFRLRQFSRFLYLRNCKVGHRHAQSLRSVMKSAYERSYWFAQIYHKFNGVHDKNGVLIFPTVSTFGFYLRLPLIDLRALRTQGLSHLLYFIVYDFSWKVGTALGYARKIPPLKKRKKGSNSYPPPGAV